ncbi:ankyrin repeat-containing domain protein [Xylaria palmicola]|nr:ankyrin repeat-containing domain protein [Xylaria palmicola]
MRELLKYPRYNSEKSRATALLRAALGGFTQLVEELLKTGITTVMKDTGGNNALHLAAQGQHPDVVTSLLRSDSRSASIFDVNAQNNYGRTPLHLAAFFGRRRIVAQTLLHNGANVGSVDKDGETALHLSSQYGHVSVVSALMDHLAEHPTPQRNVILLRYNSSEDTAFIMAVREGRCEVASAIIEKSAPLKPLELQGKKNALVESMGPDRTDLIRLLLDHEWDINARDQNSDIVLHLAAGRRLISVMELLISRGADCNAHGEKGETLLHRAILRGGKAAVQTLLKNGADNNAKADHDITPLWHASYYDRDDIVEELLKSLPRPNLGTRQSTTRWTSLHVCYNSARAIELLLAAGADPIAIDRDRNPPFF